MYLIIGYYNLDGIHHISVKYWHIDILILGVIIYDMNCSDI